MNRLCFKMDQTTKNKTKKTTASSFLVNMKKWLEQLFNQLINLTKPVNVFGFTKSRGYYIDS